MVTEKPDGGVASFVFVVVAAPPTLPNVSVIVKENVTVPSFSPVRSALKGMVALLDAVPFPVTGVPPPELETV